MTWQPQPPRRSKACRPRLPGLGQDDHCPAFPAGTRVVHVGFEDPPKLTRHLPDGEEKLAVYRRVRDEIRRFVETLPGSLANRET